MLIRVIIPFTNNKTPINDIPTGIYLPVVI